MKTKARIVQNMKNGTEKNLVRNKYGAQVLAKKKLLLQVTSKDM